MQPRRNPYLLFCSRVCLRAIWMVPPSAKWNIKLSSTARLSGNGPWLPRVRQHQSIILSHSFRKICLRRLHGRATKAVTRNTGLRKRMTKRITTPVPAMVKETELSQRQAAGMTAASGEGRSIPHPQALSLRHERRIRPRRHRLRSMAPHATGSPPPAARRTMPLAAGMPTPRATTLPQARATTAKSAEVRDCNLLNRKPAARLSVARRVLLARRLGRAAFENYSS